MDMTQAAEPTPAQPTAAEPTPSPTPTTVWLSPTVDPRGVPTQTPVEGGGAGASPSVTTTYVIPGGGGGTELPKTGLDTAGVLVPLGLGVAVIGTALIMWARRRRA